MDEIKNEKLIKELMENRENLFASVDKRIDERIERERQEAERKRIEEEQRKAKIRSNTINVAYAMLSLIYKILNEADQKKANLDVKQLDKALGTPYDGTIGDAEPSYYSFDDDELTISLNYSRAEYDKSGWGGCSFLDNIKTPVDENYLKALLEEYGVIYSRNYRDDYKYPDIDVRYTDVITLTLNKHVKEKNR